MTKKNSDKELKNSLKEIVGEELVDDAMDIVEKTLDWYGGFSTSKDFDKLTKKQGDLAESIVVDFLGLTFYNLKIIPEKWNEKTLKRYCQETLPEEKFEQTEEYFKSVTPVLFSFFTFLANNKLLANAEKLAEKVKEMEPDFLEAFGMLNSPDFEDGEDDYIDSEEILDEVYEWLLEFEKSDHYQHLTPEQQALAEEITLNFTDFMFGFHHTIPADWTEDVLEDCCVNTLPKTLPASETVFKAIYPVLANFFAFLDEVKIIENGAALVKKLKKIESKMLKNSADPALWEVEKVMVMKAVDAGIDIKDEKAMKKFIDKIAKNLQKEIESEVDDTEGGEPAEKKNRKKGRT